MRARLRQDRRWLAAALEPGNASSVDAHLRHAASLLRNRKAASPCTLMLAQVAQLFERSVPGAARREIACRKACAFCCHQRVSVTGAEALALANAIRGRPELAAAVRAGRFALAGRKAAEGNAPRLSWLRCPLLDADDGCSVYAVRPLACHGYVSVDVEDCRKALVDSHAPVREPGDYKTMRDLCRVILLSALSANGLSHAHYELTAALATALDTAKAEGRWLKGEDLFGAVPVIPMPAEAEALVAEVGARIARML
jgi:Fe-S-cluster containining protein